MAFQIVSGRINHIAMYRKKTIIGDTAFKIEDGKITMGDGSFDGLVKVGELVERMNIIEDRINDLQTSLKAHVHTGGTISGSTGTSVDFSSFTDLTETSQSDLENDTIIHGI